MTFPLVKFVESPDPAAAVRYDCNRAGEDGVASRRVMADGFTLGSPTLEGDPDAVGVTYGWRQPQFTQRVKGTKAEALAALSSLSRELLRPTNWLEVQLTATTAPIWLKIYRSGFAALSLAEVYVDTRSGDPVLVPDTWDIAVPLVADPFGYGERETLAPVTIVQDATGTNAMRYVLPTIKGDAPTPLRVQIAPQASPATTAYNTTWLAGCLNGSADMTDPVFDIGVGDGFTAGTGTAAGAADADFFGGSKRVITIDAANPNLLNRLSGLLPVVPVGRYNVQLRCQASAAGVARTLLFRLNRYVSNTIPGKTTVAVDLDVQDVDRQFWVDLGDTTIPIGIDPPPGVTGTPYNAGVAIDIGTADGSAVTVTADALKLIPIDGPTVDSITLLRATSPTFAPLSGGIVGTFDGDLETYWSYFAVGETFVEGGPTLVGGFPVADPVAEQNMLLVMAVDNGPRGDAPAKTAPWVTSRGTEAEVTVSYHPRYLHLGDGT